MDPNALLADILKIVSVWKDGPAAGTFNPEDLYDAAVDMSGHIDDLDTWLRNGGALPTRWADVRDGA